MANLKSSRICRYNSPPCWFLVWPLLCRLVVCASFPWRWLRRRNWLCACELFTKDWKTKTRPSVAVSHGKLQSLCLCL